MESMPVTFTAREGRYVFSVLDGMIEFLVDAVRRDRNDDLVGELEVRCFVPHVETFGARSALLTTRMNFHSVRGRQVMAQDIAARAQIAGVKWSGLLEDLTQRVLAAERMGSAAALDTIPPKAPAMVIETYGFKLQRDVPQILFAPGGTMKSLLVMAMLGELGRKGLRTLLLDWEMDGGEQRVRYDALGLPPTVFYRRCEQPLVRLVESIKRDVLDHDIGFLAVDSIAPACHGDVTDANVPIEFFRAWRYIGPGGMGIAHTRAEDGEQRPFGSVFWHNLARNTWFLKRVEDTSRPNLVTLGVYHRKTNFRPQPPWGLQIEVEGVGDAMDRVTVVRTDITEVAELATSLPLWQRLASALRPGPQTIAELSTQLDVKADTVRQALHRGKGRTFAPVLNTPDGVQRWSLVERRREA